MKPARRLLLLIIVLCIHPKISFALESLSDLKEIAMTAYETNEYEVALNSFVQLKQDGVESIDGESIDQKIDLCKEILTLTSYAEARVLFRQHRFDEALSVLYNDYCRGTKDVETLRQLCKTAKKEMTKTKPKVIFADKTKLELQTLGAVLFGDRDPAISSAVIYGESLAPYWDETKGKGGYINIYNNNTFPADYSVVTPFHEGLALVRKGKKWHYINTDNEIVIQNIGQLEFLGGEGMPVRDVESGIYYLYDDIVELNWKERYHPVWGLQVFHSRARIFRAFFSNGLAIVSNKKGYRRVIDKFGHTILNHIGKDYDYWPEGNFTNGYAKVHNVLGETEGLIDINGSIIIPCEYYHLTDYGSGLVGFQKAENPKEFYPIGTGGCGYMNLKGEILIPQRYQDVHSFHEGLAAVQLNGKWGYIDSLDNVIIPFIFDKAYDFGHLTNGFAHIKVGERNGFVDHFGFSTLDSIIYESDEQSSQLEKRNKEIQNSCPFIITDIRFTAETKTNTNNVIGDSIKGDEVTYIRPTVSYHGIINTECELAVKWYTPDYTIKRGNGSPSGFSYSTSKTIERGDHNMTLSGWGREEPGAWSQKGDYLMEIWYKGRLLKSQAVTIY